MRNFIDIITEAQKTAKFRLPDGVDSSLYHITNSFADYKSWKAAVLVANNGHDHAFGDMTDIGYVMISIKDNTIIPLSHDDEHNMGRDLLYDLTIGRYLGKKNMPRVEINPADYIPISVTGGNYIYSENQIKPMLIAIKKYLSYGGQDQILKGSSQLHGKSVLFSDFVASKGSVELVAGTLAPAGRLLYAEFVKISEGLVSIGMDADRIKAAPLFLQAAELIKKVSFESLGLGISSSDLKPLVENLKNAKKSNDIQALHEILFGFDGVKNIVHNGARNALKDPSNWQFSYIKAFWGDIDLAIDMLGRL